MDSSPSGGKRKNALGSPRDPGEDTTAATGTLGGSVQGIEGLINGVTPSPPFSLQRLWGGGLINPVCFCFLKKQTFFFKMVTFRASQISEEMFCIVYYNVHWLKILFYNSSMGVGFCCY